MSSNKFVAIAALLAVAEARFGQEQIPVAAVQALGAAGFGDPGVAATIAGSIPSALLAAASPCDKLSIADQMIDELGNDPQVIEAALGLVSAETNFNPFAVDVPFVCADPTLPVNTELRGVTPLVDPAVTDADVANAASAQSLNTPFDAQGLSQAEVMIAQGFTSFTAVDASGANTVLDGQDGGAGAGAGAGNGTDTGAGDEQDQADEGDVPAGCPAQTPAAGDNGQADNGADTGNNNNDGQAAGLDFGVCQPTMAFIGGLNGRPADEFTFIPQDALVAEGQQEALNPNIITNRICDQLVNVCDANDAAIAACKDAQAEIESLGTRDQSTADTWNALLGFAGTDSSAQSV
ncbi:uncharacterized protein F5Z01DRAFT_326593 [Emericellopsis atlantica]|uniref:Circumsporozoite protein n=1 Tax=Emericellopsis atlantica TaxID=2614577 RepID=A0A9P7ZUV9_9HYPO|nr:uncharacterized protein F5Z01DRAFT_326593 [Emericellopsis atlantica]KAG9258246.1 hypothetical protein F5Z01DRAFT_326593 [Emericellopsis atlantica]